MRNIYIHLCQIVLQTIRQISKRTTKNICSAFLRYLLQTLPSIWQFTHTMQFDFSEIKLITLFLILENLVAYLLALFIERRCIKMATLRAWYEQGGRGKEYFGYESMHQAVTPCLDKIIDNAI